MKLYNNHFQFQIVAFHISYKWFFAGAHTTTKWQMMRESNNQAYCFSHYSYRKRNEIKSIHYKTVLMVLCEIVSIILSAVAKMEMLYKL